MTETLRSIAGAGCARFEVDGVEMDVWSCFLNGMSYCGNIDGWKVKSCVELGIAVTRPFVRGLIALDDLYDLRKCDEWQLIQTMLAGEQYAQFMRTAVTMDKNEVYKEEQYLARAVRNKLSV